MVSYETILHQMTLYMKKIEVLKCSMTYEILHTTNPTSDDIAMQSDGEAAQGLDSIGNGEDRRARFLRRSPSPHSQTKPA
jgi:hypothetical protein